MPPTEPQDDAELATTPEVVRVLVENHRKFLSFLERRVGSREIAEDILQEAFVRGIEKAPPLGSDESAVAWFYRVLRNATIDHYRRNATAGRALEAFAHELERREIPDPEAEGAVCECVGRLAATLKPEYAEALRKVEIDGMAVKDLAASVGITSGNAGVRIFRAREALRKQVVRSCGTCATHGCLDCHCTPPPAAEGKAGCH